MENSKIAFSERKVHGDRTILVPVAAEWEEIEKHLTGAMLDAEREISAIFTRQIGKLGYASQDLHRVDRSSVLAEECECGTCEECKRHADDNAILKSLKKNLGNSEYGILLDMCVWAFSLEDVSYQRSMTPLSVISSYSKALNQWCVLRGWGEQKKI